VLSEVDHLARRGEALLVSYHRVGGSAQLLMAINSYREAVRMLNSSDRVYPDASRLKVYSGLGRSLVQEYHRTGALPLLREGAEYLEAALDAAGESSEVEHLIDLADALTHLFDYTGAQEQVDRALQLLTTVTDRPEHPFYPLALSRLVHAELITSLSDRIVYDREKLGVLAASLTAISKPTVHVHEVAYGIGLVNFFQWHLDLVPEYMAGAMYHGYKALNTCPPTLYHQHRIRSLLGRMHGQFQRIHGEGADRAAALGHARYCLTLFPFNPIYRSLATENMIIAYATFKEQADTRANLEVAIDMVEEVLHLLPPDHRRYVTLQSQRAALYIRHYEHTGQVSSLDKTIALDGPGLDKTYPNVLFNIGLAMLLRVQAFRERRLLPLLGRAYQLFGMTLDALPLTSPHRIRPVKQMLEVRQLQSEFGEVDLDEDQLVDSARKLLLDAGTAIGPEDKALALDTLATFLLSRTGLANSLDLDEIDRTIELGISAWDDSGSIYEFRVHQARTSCARYRITQVKSYADTAWSQYSALASELSAKPRERYEAVQHWIRDAQSIHDRRQASLAYWSAIKLLPHLGYIGEDAITRREALMHARGIACQAAAHELASDNMDTAIELLEQGRSVFWTQLLRLRSHHDVAPVEDLAQIDHLVQELQKTEETNWAGRRRKVEELDTLITSIRNKSGYEHFMAPRPFADLMTAVDGLDGHVVILIPSDSVCDVVMLGATSGSSRTHLRLPAVNVGSLEVMSDSLRSAADQERRGDDMRGMKKVPPTAKAGPSRDEVVLRKLWDTLVKPIVETLGLMVSTSAASNSLSYSLVYKKTQGTSRPRLWWLPTGPLTFLPLHAAGIYTGKVAECLSDYAVSSYVPTLSALAEAGSRPTGATRSSSKILLLAPIENSSNLPQLPHALAEISSIETLIGNEAVVQSDIPDQTVDSVLRLIPQANIVHFACHGQQINADPLQSGFELSDGRLTLSHLTSLHIPHGQLAYLSACESAAVDANQPDEAVNIATAMLYVGFKSIIATLW
jgi:tetratricopeptide (TPR) repeat protein